jgi:hypothetical protein
MRRAIKAGGLYFALVFAVAFLVGVVRVMVLAPRVGALPAVAIEVPLILGVSWIACRFVLQRIPVDGVRNRLAMGVFAFAALMATEAGLDLAFGHNLAEHFAAMGTPAGLLGLAGQIGFAALPLIRR